MAFITNTKKARHSKTKAIVRPETLPSLTYREDTPDGTLWVTIDELNGMPYEIHIRVGKAGLSLRAWCDAVANLINRMLKSGIGLSHAVMALSGLSSDKIRTLPNGAVIRSTPEGIAYVLMSYIRHKTENSMKKGGPSFEFGEL